MEYRRLGNTGLTVSRICLGSLTMGPLQAHLSITDGSRIILEAIDRGINFIDAAEMYDTYPYIKQALKQTKKDIVIASRSYAYTRQMAIDSIEKARKELDRDVIEIFGLHQQESEHTLRGHREALEYFLEAKQKGIIKAILVTTHCIRAVNAAKDLKEVDIIHPLINKNGLGIEDGTIEQMLGAVEYAHSKGKGIYSMKPLGGGNLLLDYKPCMDFVLEKKFIDSVAIGMKSVEELDLNVRYFSGENIEQNELEKLVTGKSLNIDYWCQKCGNCIKRCSQKALSMKDGKVQVDKSKCLLCGYCGSVCPAFAIKVV
jgi:aryl-alcohol dehydrogenase-like predicted oxidoreductase